MRSRESIGRNVASDAGRALMFVAVAFLCACAMSGTKRAGKFEVLEGGGGFTITEQTRFGSGTRRDFESAIELIEAGEVAAGIDLLKQVVAESPDATAAHIDLGIAYRLANEFALAETSLGRALALNPRHPVAHNELGLVQRKLGRFEEARSSYERALAIAPDFHYAQRNLAILCDVYLGDLACAIEHYELYARSVPQDPKVGMWLADLRNRVGK